MTQEQELEWKARQAVRQKAHYKANANKIKLQNKAWRESNPEKIKLRRKTYCQTLQYKAAQKAYRQTPQYKASQKAYDQTPERKALRAAQSKVRSQTPERKAYFKARDKVRQQNRVQKPRCRTTRSIEESKENLKLLWRSASKSYREANPEKIKDKSKRDNQKTSQQRVARNYMTALAAAQDFIKAMEAKPKTTKKKKP